MRRLFSRSGFTERDIALFEINEAFAGVAVYAVRELGLDPTAVNVNGGGGWLASMRALLAEQRYALVIPCDERNLLPLQRHRDELSRFARQPGRFVPFPSSRKSCNDR